MPCDINSLLAIRCNDTALQSDPVQRAVWIQFLCEIARVLDPAYSCHITPNPQLLCQNPAKLRLTQVQVMCENLNVDCAAFSCLSPLRQEALKTQLVCQIADSLQENPPPPEEIGVLGGFYKAGNRGEQYAYSTNDPNPPFPGSANIAINFLFQLPFFGYTVTLESGDFGGLATPESFVVPGTLSGQISGIIIKIPDWSSFPVNDPYPWPYPGQVGWDDSMYHNNWRGQNRVSAGPWIAYTINPVLRLHAVPANLNPIFDGELRRLSIPVVPQYIDVVGDVTMPTHDDGINPPVILEGPDDFTGLTPSQLGGAFGPTVWTVDLGDESGVAVEFNPTIAAFVFAVRVVATGPASFAGVKCIYRGTGVPGGPIALTFLGTDPGSGSIFAWLDLTLFPVNSPASMDLSSPGGSGSWT